MTFRNLTEDEKQIFKRIVQEVTVPASAWGIYLSPSARNQMLYTNQGQPVPEAAMSSPDSGVILLSCPNSSETIINALLAHPPHTPAVDVYDKGALLAGYVFETIDGCLAGMSNIVATHLGPASPHGHQDATPDAAGRS